MRKIIFAAAVATAAIAAQAPAQVINTPTTFRGFRIEGDIGWDRARANGVGQNNMGYGGTAGIDGQIGKYFVVGAEGTYWNPSKMWGVNNGDNMAIIGNADIASTKAFQEWDASIRMGFLAQPDILLYAVGGYATTRERTFNVIFDGRGTGSRGVPGYSNVGWSDGYSVGGGVEYSISKMFFMNAQYRYSQFSNHTSRQRATLGFGVRFR